MTPWSMLARMSWASSLTWCSVRRMASWRCWSQSVASVQSRRTAEAIDRTMIRAPMSCRNASISEAGTGPGRESQASSIWYSSRTWNTAAALRTSASNSVARTIAAVMRMRISSFEGMTLNISHPLPRRFLLWAIRLRTCDPA